MKKHFQWPYARGKKSALMAHKRGEKSIHLSETVFFVRIS
jgi:hypothetical protein